MKGSAALARSSRLCRLRKKTAETIQHEISQEVASLLEIIFTGFRKSGYFDLEAVELATRTAAHHVGAVVVQNLLNAPTSFESDVPCRCGRRARFHAMRSKQVVSVVGPITIERPYYVCAHCHQGQNPRDAQPDLVDTQYSPGVRRMLAVVGSDSSFDHGREQLELLPGLEVTTKAVERQAEAIGADVAQQEQAKIQRAVQLDLPEILGSKVPVLYIEMDGTQVPMVRSEREGRKGRIAGQPPRTREVKLGCVFTQTTPDPQGRPVRDAASTTYAGAIEESQQFGRRIYTEAWERGWSRADQKVVLGDGSDWIWNIADQHFPGAIHIVDVWHAREHLWDLAGRLFPSDEKQRKRWAKNILDKLDAGRIESLVAQLQREPTPQPDLQNMLRTEAEYFQRNQARMRYPRFRKLGLFIGSGVIEAACKTVIGSRLKQSGMFWTVCGVNAIVALRCHRFSDKFEDYWASRSRVA
jgi:hypothetical protein